jgi:hypothetical protein
MPSTFSPSLKIELPSTGTQSGIWGLTTNNNLGTLIEQAVTGVQSIVMADANYTLTNYNGVSDEARNAILVVTGTNAAVRDIIAPLVNKIYTIRNATTGGFGIRIIGVTGTGITIPNGYTTTVYCDTTNFNQSLSAVTGNFNVVGNELVGGTLGVTGVLSGTTASFSGAISAVSPTFTGVPTAPTASPGTNTTQLATTAFVTTAVASAFPSGTRLPFAQAAAPTGWTQDTSDNANNRMLRVVSGTGNSVGGSASPILMNVVPSHTHTVSSSGTTASADLSHTHGVTGSGTTSAQSNGHTHDYSGTTSGQSVTHSHAVSDPGHSHTTQNFLGNYAGGSQNGTNNIRSFGFDEVSGTNSATTGITLGNASVDHSHTYSGTTSDISANHTHTVSVSGTSGPMSANSTHTHTVTASGTTAANGSASDWAPRYIDLIICAKN